MKTKSADTIVSPEDHVRLKIYEGDIPLEGAGVEILRMLIQQEGKTRRIDNAVYLLAEKIQQSLAIIAEAHKPAPRLAWWKRIFGVSA